MGGRCSLSASCQLCATQGSSAINRVSSLTSTRACACACVASTRRLVLLPQLAGGLRAFVVAERRVDGNTTICFHIKVGCLVGWVEGVAVQLYLQA